jgi:hypothetical protein
MTYQSLMLKMDEDVDDLAEWLSGFAMILQCCYSTMFPTPGRPEKWLNFLGKHVVRRNVPVYPLLLVCWWVTEKKQQNATLSALMLPKVQWQIVSDKRSLTKKDFPLLSLVMWKHQVL